MNRIYSTSWQYEFSAELSRVWEMVSNTDRMSYGTGMPPVTYKNVVLPLGGTQRIGSYRQVGITLVWDEHPYEWIENEFFSVERAYKTGPFTRMKLTWDFRPSAKGCVLVHRVEVESRFAFLLPITILFTHASIRLPFMKYYRQVDQVLRALKSVPFTPLSSPFTPEKKVAKRAADRLFTAEIDESLHPKFKDLLFKREELDLIRIRPFVVAKEWNLDRDQTLTAFLKTAHAGLFDLSWDIICPSCKGAKSRTSTLAQVKKEVHCDACNIKFDAQFDRSIELSFTPSPAIRKISASEYCAGSPQKTQHIVAQLRVQAGEERAFTVSLQNGNYLFRSLQAKRNYPLLIHVEQDRCESIPLEFGARGEDEVLLGAQEGQIEFRIKNYLSDEMILHLERDDYKQDACTAAYVSCFQGFRDLFSTEVLSEGVELSVASISILFTDLKDSTALYQKVGDARGFALVNDHLAVLKECVRRNSGAVIKTIGDAVMASFLKPEDALMAALNIRSIMAASPIIPEIGEPLQVKIGIHTGPCFVVNSNQGLDYFGSTVNLAARTQGASETSGILITGRMLDDPGVKEYMRKTQTTATQIVREIKGFEGDLELYNIGFSSLNRT